MLDTHCRGSSRHCSLKRIRRLQGLALHATLQHIHVICMRCLPALYVHLCHITMTHGQGWLGTATLAEVIPGRRLPEHHSGGMLASWLPDSWRAHPTEAALPPPHWHHLPAGSSTVLLCLSPAHHTNMCLSPERDTEHEQVAFHQLISFNSRQ